MQCDSISKMARNNRVEEKRRKNKVIAQRSIEKYKHSNPNMD